MGLLVKSVTEGMAGFGQRFSERLYKRWSLLDINALTMLYTIMFYLFEARKTIVATNAKVLKD